MSSSYRVNYQLRTHRRDQLIEFIKTMLLTPFALHTTTDATLQEAYAVIFERIEMLIDDHRLLATRLRSRACSDATLRRVEEEEISQLKSMVPSIQSFFTALPLKRAFIMYDAKTHVSKRRCVPISFNDIRHILNLSQVLEIADKLKLITFDGDQTLYEDGGTFDSSSPMVDAVVQLLRSGIYVALVTAAGYKGKPEKYEERLAGLLLGMKERGVEPDIVKNFLVMGGECNYLFQCDGNFRLQEIPFDRFALDEMRAWPENEVQNLVGVAEQSLKDTIARLQLKVEVLRKDRGVGTITPKSVPLNRETLEELVLCAKKDLTEKHVRLPYCAFNGGNDVWVDVGNKHYGVCALQMYLKCSPDTALHVGDQFLSTGNDISTRGGSCTVWVCNPEETADIIGSLLSERARLTAVAK